VLEGPHGPVSHLICGGVYDWSTGLVYRGGRYFDPNLGIWLALMPLMVVQGWSKRKDRRVDGVIFFLSREHYLASGKTSYTKWIEWTPINNPTPSPGTPSTPPVYGLVFYRK